MGDKLNIRRIIEKCSFARYEIKRGSKTEEVVINVCANVQEAVAKKGFFDFDKDCSSCKSDCNVKM